MATKKPGNNRAGNRGSSRRVNNPDGNNQYSGAMGAVRKNPLATAAAIGSAVAAGVFLWSRRNEISDQVSNLSQQINGWRDRSMNEDDATGAAVNEDSFMATSHPVTSQQERSQVDIAQEALTLKELGNAD